MLGVDNQGAIPEAGSDQVTLVCKGRMGLGWGGHSREGHGSSRLCSVGIYQEKIEQQCSRACEWTGGVCCLWKG